jgi:Nucleotidyl transferase AbiEii toxin, Type IV TA system
MGPNRVTERARYATPTAFRTALTDRLGAVARTGRWTLQQLQRQIAYDRLLARLYFVDDNWVVKGAVALLARELSVRATIDLDVYRDTARDLAEVELRQAAARDIGDWFRFELGPSQPVADGAPATRLRVKAYIGTTVWQDFRVDLVGADVRMTEAPENVSPLARVGMPDFEQRGYRAYPLVDHVADKVVATFQRYGARRLPSTRYRDLVDLVAISSGAAIAADRQLRALAAQTDRRGLELPTRFDVPDRTLWEAGYAAEAARSFLTVAHTLDEALALVGPFLNPLLDGTATGIWNPSSGVWDRIG